VKWIWLEWGGVFPPPKKMRRALVRAVWQHGREAVLCVLALRKLCV
jgi:hypothetical protein